MAARSSSSSRRRRSGPCRDGVLVLTLLVLLLPAAALVGLLDRTDLALPVGTLLRRLTEARVDLAGARLHLPDTLVLTGLRLAGGRLPAPLAAERVILTFDAAALLRGLPPVTSLRASGLSLPLRTDGDGRLDDRSRRTMASLGLLLTGLRPRHASVDAMGVALATPLLPGLRSLQGRLSFDGTESGYDVAGAFAGGELSLRVTGGVRRDELTGRFALSLASREPTALACPLGSGATGVVRYTTQALVRAEADTVTVTMEGGRSRVTDARLSLPWLAGVLRVVDARLTREADFVVDHALLDLDGTPLTYAGPLTPTAERPALVTAHEVDLASLLRRLAPHLPPPPPFLAGARLSAALRIEGCGPEALGGRVELSLPALLPDGTDAVRIGARLAMRDRRLILEGGSLSGPLACDGWDARIDDADGTIHLSLDRLHAPLALASHLTSWLPAGVGGHLLLSADLSAPLHGSPAVTGELALAVAADVTGLPTPLGPLQGLEARVALETDGVRLRSLVARGPGPERVELMGRHGPDLTTLSFLATDLALPGSPTRGSARGVWTRTSGGETLEATLRCAGLDLDCSPLPDGRHVLRLTRGGTVATLTLPLPSAATLASALASGLDLPLSGTPADVTVTAGGIDARLTARLLRATTSALTLRILDGSISSRYASLTVAAGCSATVDGTGIRVDGLLLGDAAEGTVALSGRVGPGGALEAELRSRNLLLTLPELPALRLSGNLSLADPGSDLSFHGALVASAVLRDGLRTASCLVGFAHGRLDVERARLRGADGDVTLTGSLPLSPAAGPLALSLTATTFDLSLLRSLSPALRGFGGLVSGTLSVGGSLADPALGGELTLADGLVPLPGGAGTLRGLGLTARLQGRRLVVERLRAVHDALGTFSLARFEADEVVLLPRPAARLAASGGRLTSSGVSLEGLGFQGALTPSGLLEGRLDADRIRVESERTSPPRGEELEPVIAALRSLADLPATVRVTLAVPRNVRLRTPAISAEFGGELRLTAGRGALDADGALDLVRGDLYVQGRRFELTRGSLSLGRSTRADGASPTGSVPLPRLDLTGSATVSSVPVELHLAGSPLTDDGMVASLSSDWANYSQDSLVQMVSLDERSRPALAGSLLPGIGLGSLTNSLERTLRRLLPFDDVGIGGDYTLDGDRRPTVVLGRYLADGVYLNLEGGFVPSEKFLQELAIDLTPPDSNVRLSYARSLSGADEGASTMAVEYSVRF